MGLTADIQTAVTAAFDAAGDLVTVLEVTRETVGEYDPVTGSKPSLSERWSGRGIRAEYQQSEIDGTAVRAGDIQFLAELKSVAPEVGDTATVGGVDWRVQGVTPLSPGDTAFMYTLQLRK